MIDIDGLNWGKEMRPPSGHQHCNCIISIDLMSYMYFESMLIQCCFSYPLKRQTKIAADRYKHCVVLNAQSKLCYVDLAKRYIFPSLLKCI